MGLAKYVGFATNYVIQLLKLKDGSQFHPGSVLHNLYGKFTSSMKTDYRRDWKNHERIFGKLSDRDQVHWMLEWLEEHMQSERDHF